MTIGIDGTALYGKYGGVEYSLWNLLSALNEVDTSNSYVVYIPLDGPTEEATRAFKDRWRWSRLPFTGRQKLRRILWQQCVLPRQLQRDNCDIVHAPTYVAPLRADIPIVLTVYDLIAILQPRFATWPNRLHYGWALPRSIARASEIIVNAHQVKAQLTELTPAKLHSTHVIPLGVEPIFRPASESDKSRIRSKYHLPDRFILFVGNFEPKKNLESLVKAVELKAGLPPLFIVGGVRAWKRNFLTTTRRTSSQAKTLPATVLGYVPREDLPILYSACEVFVFPTLCEGFGLPVLEALCCGAPVVTSAAALLPNLSSLAHLCDPCDPRSIANSILEVLTDNEAKERARELGPGQAQIYSWPHVAEATLKVYEAALAKAS